jgi:hypothetical protein
MTLEVESGSSGRDSALEGASESGAGPAGAPRLTAVRVTRPADFFAVRPLLEQYHRESRYRHIPLSGRKLERLAEKVLDNPADMLGAYIRYGDKVVGVVHANVGDYHFGEGGRMVTVQGVYVPASVRASLLGGRVFAKLMRVLGDWAKAQDATELHIYSTSGIAPERTDRMLRRLGFTTYGGCYVASVQ